MFEAFDNDDIRAEIQYRRRRVHICTDEILCQRPRVTFIKHRIYIHWAMYYVKKLLQCDSVCIIANILVYARPTSSVRFSMPFYKMSAILRTDVGHPCYDASTTAPEKERERRELCEALRYHIRIEASFSMQRRSLLENEVLNLNRLRTCRARLPLPSTRLAF